MTTKGNVTAIICANNSSLDCEGQVDLSLSIGCSTFTTSFFVVENLLSGVDAILGIRSMKKMNLSLRPADDCAYIKNIVIPFDRTIASATTVLPAGPEN